MESTIEKSSTQTTLLIFPPWKKKSRRLCGKASSMFLFWKKSIKKNCRRLAGKASSMFLFWKISIKKIVDDLWESRHQCFFDRWGSQSWVSKSGSKSWALWVDQKVQGCSRRSKCGGGLKSIETLGSVSQSKSAFRKVGIVDRSTSAGVLKSITKCRGSSVDQKVHRVCELYFFLKTKKNWGQKLDRRKEQGFLSRSLLPPRSSCSENFCFIFSKVEGRSCGFAAAFWRKYQCWKKKMEPIFQNKVRPQKSSTQIDEK